MFLTAQQHWYMSILASALPGLFVVWASRPGARR